MTFYKIDYDSPAYWRTLRMRECVLRLPLGMRYTKVDIEKEKDECMYVAEENGKIIASCQFIMENTSAKMRQVATSKNSQGKGVGKALYQYCEAKLKQMGITEIYCHARWDARTFYEKLDFQVVSEVFEEVGIPHIKMKKKLR